MDSFEISSDSYDPRTLRNSGNAERQENTTARQPQPQTKNTQRSPHAPSADTPAATKARGHKPQAAERRLRDAGVCFSAYC